SSATALRLGLRAQARAARADRGGQRRHCRLRGGDRPPRPRGRGHARACGLPRPLAAAPAGRGLVRRPGVHAPRDDAPPAALRRGAARARCSAQAHHPPRARPVPRRARWARLPPGAERGRASPRRGLVAGGARACRDRRGGSGRVLTRDPAGFLAVARGLAPDFGPPTARAAFLVAPDGFGRAAESAIDNRYMAAAEAYDAARASAEHRALHRALSSVLPVACFPGDPDAPDALFPNNVFATVPGT